MNNSQIISDLYHYLIHNLPTESLDLIIQNDIRVENYFTINSGVFFENLKQKGEILEYQFQHTIILDNTKRVHIDIVFVDSLGTKTYLELKHFSISQKRGKRSLSFYTSNSKEGSKVGMVGDCKKFGDLEYKGELDKKQTKYAVHSLHQNQTKKIWKKWNENLKLIPNLKTGQSIILWILIHKTKN